MSLDRVSIPVRQKRASSLRGLKTHTDRQLGYRRQAAVRVGLHLIVGREPANSTQDSSENNTTERTSDYKLGDVGYGDVESHAVDNVGTSDIRVLIVDLKTPRAAKEAGEHASLPLASVFAGLRGARRY